MASIKLFMLFEAKQRERERVREKERRGGRREGK